MFSAEEILYFLTIPYLVILFLYKSIKQWNNNRGGGNISSSSCDPQHTSALMTNGGFGTEDKDDTVIHAVLGFDSIITKQELMELFKTRKILKHTGFNSIPTTEPKGSSCFVWKPVEHFVLAHHFIEHSNNTKSNEKPISSKAELDNKIQDICNNNTYIRKEGDKMPWWRVHLLNHDDRTTLIVCIHHGIADGLGCLRVFSSLLSSDRKNTPIDNAAFFQPSRGADPLGGDRGIFASILKPWRWHRAILESLDFWICFTWTVMNYSIVPADTLNDFMSYGRSQPLADLILHPGKLPKVKNVMVPMPTHSLELIKKIKNAAGKGMTVNDVEYALYSGMMRRYLLKFGNMTEAQMKKSTFRSMTPFNVPLPMTPEKKFTHTMVNSWAFIINSLPTAPSSAKERLILANKLWQPLKKRSYVPAAFEATKLAGDMGAPLFLHQLTCRLMFSKNSVIFSNLPGPSEEELYICGAKMVSVNAFHPCGTAQAIVISLSGQMQYSLTVPMNEELEKRNGTDGDVRVALPKMFLEELDELRSAMGV